MNNVYVGNKGSAIIGKQSAKGTAITPTFAVPYNTEDLTTTIQKNIEKSIKGNRNANQVIHQGRRTHVGTMRIPGYSNCLAHMFNMLMTRGSVSGSDPYTIPFTVGDSEQYYSVDMKKGNYVHRFLDVKANSAAMALGGDMVEFDFALVALKAFSVAKVASVSGSGPYVLTFDTDYDPAPTYGITTSDTLIFYDVSLGTETEVAVSSLTSTTVTTSTNVSAAAAGDLIYIKAATPSFSLGDLFLWPRTEFRFGADASTALSATHTPADEGTTFSLKNNNENDSGSIQSGSYDPTDIRRTTFDADFTFEKVYDEQLALQRYLDNDKYAVVIRMFGDASTHEFRLTLNNIKSTDSKHNSAGDGIVKIMDIFKPQYDSTDTQMVDVKIICGLTTV